MSDIYTLELRPDRASEATTEAASQFFSSITNIKSSFLKRLLGREEGLVFEILSFEQKTHFLVHLPEGISSYIESQVAAQYPKASIIAFVDSLEEKIQDKHVAFAPLVLSGPSYLPLKTWRDFTDSDPLSSVLGAMTKGEKGDLMLVQIVVLSAGGGWRRRGSKVISAGVPTGVEGERAPHPQAALIEGKIAQNGFRVGIRLLCASSSQERSSQLVSSLAGSFGALTLGESNSFRIGKPRFYQTKRFLRAILERKTGFVPRGSVLTVDELATIFHLPGAALSEIRNVSWGGSLLGEPPDDLPVATGEVDDKGKINFFAKTEFKNRLTVFGIKRDDRRRHMYIMGKTGTGKSTLIANMAINDMRNGEGLAVVDPHGDLSEILLDYIPSFRINDVAYLDAAASATRPFRMNLFEVRNPEQGELVASGIVSIFQKLYGFSWGPRLEYILRNSILTLVGRPDSTLVDVPRILTDQAFRRSVVERMGDTVLKKFWVDEFEKMNERLMTDAISPILNKVGQFVSSPTIRAIIGHPTSTINLEETMNEGKIVILNLSQGRLGEDNAALLGAMMITKIQLAAMNRAAIAEEARRDFYLYVDEFQNFATDSFIKIFSEARKYRLNLAVANQYIGQLPEEVQKAIFGNMGTLMSFLVGAADAQVLTREYGGVYTEDDLVSLDNFQLVVKLAVDGRTSRPFFAYSLPLPKAKNQNREKVIQVSREKYTREVASPSQSKVGSVEQRPKEQPIRQAPLGVTRDKQGKHGGYGRHGGRGRQGRNRYQGGGGQGQRKGFQSGGHGQPIRQAHYEQVRGKQGQGYRPSQPQHQQHSRQEQAGSQQHQEGQPVRRTQGRQSNFQQSTNRQPGRQQNPFPQKQSSDLYTRRP